MTIAQDTMGPFIPEKIRRVTNAYFFGEGTYSAQKINKTEEYVQFGRRERIISREMAITEQSFSSVICYIDVYDDK